MPRQYVPDVEEAIAELKSFHNGDLGLLSVMACGAAAVPALQRLLLERERSGLYQARCRAVEALAALGAHEILIEFLEAERSIADPIERVGEDAVINAAALALANIREQHVFQLLLWLGKRPALTGVIRALSAFGREEAIPLLIDALQEDASRHTAEKGLRKLGRPALEALLEVATAQGPPNQRESETSARRRRSALRLLSEMGISPRTWSILRPLMHDVDTKIATLACRICLDQAPVAEWPEATRRLIGLLAHEDWMIREDVQNCLAAHFNHVEPEIERFLSQAPSLDANGPATHQTEIALRHIIERARQVSAGS